MCIVTIFQINLPAGPNESETIKHTHILHASRGKSRAATKQKKKRKAIRFAAHLHAPSPSADSSRGLLERRESVFGNGQRQITPRHDEDLEPWRDINPQKVDRRDGMGRDSASDEPSASVSQKREADRGMEMMHTHGSEKKFNSNVL